MPNVRIYPDNHHTILSSQAQEFREGYEIRNSTTLLDRARQKNLIIEEFKEFLEAEGNLWHDSPSYPAAALKELADLVYVCYQYAENMNWNLDEALFRVHESNMSKLGEDGHPVKREDGKVLKGPNYKPPNLEDLI